VKSTLKVALKSELPNVKVYGEERGMRINVKEMEGVKEIMERIQIKLAN
jgi:hypothetical protein